MRTYFEKKKKIFYNMILIWLSRPFEFNVCRYNPQWPGRGHGGWQWPVPDIQDHSRTRHRREVTSESCGSPGPRDPCLHLLNDSPYFIIGSHISYSSCSRAQPRLIVTVWHSVTYSGSLVRVCSYQIARAQCCSVMRLTAGLWPIWCCSQAKLGAEPVWDYESLKPGQY